MLDEFYVRHHIISGTLSFKFNIRWDMWTPKHPGWNGWGELMCTGRASISF